MGASSERPRVAFSRPPRPIPRTQERWRSTRREVLVDRSIPSPGMETIVRWTYNTTYLGLRCLSFYVRWVHTSQLPTCKRFCPTYKPGLWWRPLGANPDFPRDVRRQCALHRFSLCCCISCCAGDAMSAQQQSTTLSSRTKGVSSYRKCP